MGMSDTTLREFFGISVKGFWDDILAQLQSGGSLSELKNKIIDQAAPAHWPNLVSGLGEQMIELFDVDIGWLLVSAWSKYGELKEYANPKKHRPDESILVPLGKHTLKLAYSPYLEILFNDRPVGKLALDTTLAFDVEGFVLTIQDGKIMKARTGTCQGSGKIEYKGHTLVKRDLAKFALPGTFEFKEGIKLERTDGGQR
jgi:hypothetical protein